MSFSDAVRTCFSKYVTFSGRATRPEYWWFVLFTILGSIVLLIVDTILFGPVQTVQQRTDFFSGETELVTTVKYSGPISGLFSLLVLIPSISAGWRRMHDTGKSGLYLIYPLIVITGVGIARALLLGPNGGALGWLGGVIMWIGIFVLFISPLLVLWWLTRPTQPGDNEYGPNPIEAHS